MATDLDPWLKNYITDVSSQVNTRQLENPFCKRIESQLAHCMEAYGKERAPDSCKLLLLDFHECLTLRKQLLRVTAMRNERDRQWKAGERTTRYALPPRQDSF